MSTFRNALALPFLAFAAFAACADSSSTDTPAENNLTAPTGDAGAPAPTPTATATAIVATPAPTGTSIGDGGLPQKPQPGSSCVGKTGLVGDHTITLGSLRTADIHVPPTYNPSSDTMLVMSFHGLGDDSTTQATISNMNPLADAKRFITVYPNGLSNSWNAGTCCGASQAFDVDDVTFVKDLLVQVQKEYCVDVKRTYATGLSAGAFFVHRLACEMSTTFAAVAPVAGVIGIGADACKPSRAVPILEFHGTADPIISFDGEPLLGFPSVDDTISFWRQTNGCGPNTQNTFSQGDTTCTKWVTCKNASDVTLCKTTEGGHTWPGAAAEPLLGKTSTDIDATKTMVDFFIAHPMN